MEKPRRIFVLADTHNKFPAILSILARDADEIWHLGDVCAEAILDELRAIGPRVIVVRGNCDTNIERPLAPGCRSCSGRIEDSFATYSAGAAAG